MVRSNLRVRYFLAYYQRIQSVSLCFNGFLLELSWYHFYPECIVASKMAASHLSYLQRVELEEYEQYQQDYQEWYEMLRGHIVISVAVHTVQAWHLSREKKKRRRYRELKKVTDHDTRLLKKQSVEARQSQLPEK